MITGSQSLEPLLKDIRACTFCVGLPLGPNPILQAGVGARILIVGQAPGRIAHEKGRPFDDPSGKRLWNWLGVERESFYNPSHFAIAPMGFCFPGKGKGGDAPPRPECAPRWRTRLLAMLPNIELTILLGVYAQRWHLPEAEGTLAQRAGQWREHWPRILPLPHPSPRNTAWFKKNPWFESDVVPVLRARVAQMLAS